MSKVMIGIQARSGSTRLPKKAFEMIGERRMLDHVIDACKSAGRYLSKFERNKTEVEVVVLTPFGDPILEAFKTRCKIMEGSEQDVLSRYARAADELKPDLIVRITGDCPLIPDFVITKHIKNAILNSYDYLSNVDEETRTAIDGHDCEVISKRLLEYLDTAALHSQDREHVTTLARREPPKWAKMGTIVNYLDYSAMKLSVDTADDLDRVRDAYEARDGKLFTAERKFGKGAVHRL